MSSIKDPLFWLGVAIVFILAVYGVVGPLPEGVPRHPWADIRPGLQPVYHFLAPLLTVVGGLWLGWFSSSRPSPSQPRPHSLHAFASSILIILGGWVGVTGYYADPILGVEHVERKGQSVIALSGDFEQVWVSDLGAEVVFVDGPRDLTGDGVREVVAVTRPGGDKSDRLLVLNENRELMFDSDEVASIIVTGDVHAKASEVWQPDDDGLLRISSRNLITDGGGTPTGLKVDGKVVISLERGYSFLSDIFRTWGEPPQLFPDPDQPYEITDIQIVREVGSPTSFIALTARPTSGGGHSAVIIVRLQRHEGDLLEVHGGVYWHPGSILISAILEASVQDFGGPLIVVTGDNALLLEARGQHVAVVFGLGAEHLSEGRCWNLSKDDAASVLQEGQTLGLDPRCFDDVPSQAQPWYELSTSPVQLWYRWIEPPGLTVLEGRIELSPPGADPFVRPISGYSMVFKLAEECEFEVEAVYGYTINSPYGSGCIPGIELNP